MVITLINPSPSKARRFKIKSKSKKESIMKRSSTATNAELRKWAQSPWGIPKKGKGSRMKKAKTARRKVAKVSKVRRAKAVKRGAHRPIVIWSGKRFMRPKNSRLFRKPTRINPRKSRRSKYLRRNPLRLPLNLNRSLMAGIPVAGGIALAMFAMPQIAKFLPSSLKGQGKFFGLAHVVLGLAAMTFVKKDVVKVVGGTLFATGLYDLIACNIPQLKLPPLPGRTSVNGAFAASYGADEVVGASFTEVGTDYVPAGVGASYGDEVGDDIDYGGDSIEIG